MQHDKINLLLFMEEQRGVYHPGLCRGPLAPVSILLLKGLNELTEQGLLTYETEPTGLGFDLDVYRLNDAGRQFLNEARNANF